MHHVPYAVQCFWTQVNCIDMDSHQVVFGTAGTELVLWDRKANVYDFNGDIASYLPNYEKEVISEPEFGLDNSLEAMQALIKKIEVEMRCLQLKRHQVCTDFHRTLHAGKRQCHDCDVILLCMQ